MKSPHALKSPGKSTPVSSAKKMSKKKEKLNISTHSQSEILSPSERGKKRPREFESEESDALNASVVSIEDKSTSNAKRARVLSKATKASPGTSPSEESITATAGQKTILLGAIRKRLTELDSRTLYVRKLPRNTTVSQLKTLCPTSVSARIQSSHHSNRRKHAFIEFKSEEIARAALASINGKLVADRPVTAELCSERTSRPTQSDSNDLERRRPHWIPPDKRTLQDFCLTSLYVTCIPRVATQDDLRQLFDKAESFDFNMNMKHNSIGSCRIVFPNEQEALEAFNSKHGFLLHDSPLIVNFAFRKHGRRKTQDDASVPKETASSVVKLKGASMQSIKPKKPEPKLLSEVQGIQKSKKDGQPKKTKHDKQPGLQNSTPKNVDLLKKKPVSTKKQKLAKAQKQ